MPLLPPLLSSLHLNNSNGLCMTNENRVIYKPLVKDRKQLDIWYYFRLKFQMFGPNHIFRSRFLSVLVNSVQSIYLYTPLKC